MPLDGDEGETPPAGYSSVSAYWLWLWSVNKDATTAESRIQRAAYGYGEPNQFQPAITDVLQVNTNTYLIPIKYFIDAYENDGYEFDSQNTENCPFYYAPDAENSTAKLTRAAYVHVGDSWYVQVQDTGTTYSTPPRNNVYLDLAQLQAKVVEDTVSPTGTVINLFDYWTTAKTENDVTENYYDSGINSNHALKFKAEGLSGANAWTSSINPYQGIVQDTLVNGYPALFGSASFVVDNDGNTQTSTESLAYLFDPNQAVTVDDGTSYKESYKNVTGLLQQDEDGYYYYDSQKNYAEFDANRNQFTLYDTWSLWYQSSWTAPIYGQFFPFSPFKTAGKFVNSGQDVLNHFFGLTLTARFTQQYGGHTNGSRNTDMVFEFSGDDDVWIFVDNVLVADLGGIHDPASVSIDFSTGKVTINGNPDSDYSTTLHDAYKNANKEGTTSWTTVTDTDGNTNTIYADGTYHTLKFFYLERGSYASNLSLKYNLTDYLPVSINKEDQYGGSVAGARFAVYSADENYCYLLDPAPDSASQGETEAEYVSLAEGSYTVDADTGIITITAEGNDNVRTITPGYVGVTDENGKMIFTDPEYNTYYSLRDLEDQFGTHMVMREISLPEGYREISDEVHLYIYQHKLLLCGNTWESGVYSSTTLQVSAPYTLKLVDPSKADGGSSDSTIQYIQESNNSSLTKNGTLFAVVLKYIGSTIDELTNQSNWAPVYGTAEEGFHVVDVESGTGDDNAAFINAVLKAVKQYKESTPVFALDQNTGEVTAKLNGLPGDVTTYYTMLGEGQKQATQYTVAYYYSTAASLDGASSGNTFRIDADAAGYNFTRIFGATIDVPNLVNRLVVQKLDEQGNLVNGAAFGLYQVAQPEGSDTIYYVADGGTKIALDGSQAKLENGAAGDYTIDPETGSITVQIGETTYTIKPVSVQTTVPAEQNTVGEDGTASFVNIKAGTYCLRELRAPDGFVRNPAEVLVLVDDTAVYANAGTADDGVTVGRGPGYVVSTLDQFASQGKIDNTLTWVYEQLLVSEPSTSFANVYTALGENGMPSWQYLQSYTGSGFSAITGTTQDADQALTTYLVYDKNGENTLFNYTLNSARKPLAGENVNVGTTRRLYTSVGWSYYLLYQDTAYGAAKAAANGAAYEELLAENDSPMEISNLFSRSTFVQFTDQRLPEEPAPSTPGPESSAPPEKPHSPENPTSGPEQPEAPVTPAPAAGSALPQTGQMNWPVLVLALLGLCLLAVGAVLRWRGTRHEK